MGGSFLSEAVNGHPYAAFTGSHNDLESAIDGKPGDLISQKDKTSGSAPAPAVPMAMSTNVPSANGFAPPTVNMNNVIPPATPQGASAPNPLSSVQTMPPANGVSGASPSSQVSSTAMAHVQSPEFGSFIHNLSQNLDQNNQGT